MPDELDVYQLCPCGSGKKLKFCCQAIVGEMLKIAELQQSHQHRAALTLLETIEKKVQRAAGGKSLYFRDPAGNSVELVTPGLWRLPSG